MIGLKNTKEYKRQYCFRKKSFTRKKSDCVYFYLIHLLNKKKFFLCGCKVEYGETDNLFHSNILDLI